MPIRNPARPRALARSLARSERGAVTVEMVLWLPFLFLLLALVTDVSLAFFSKAEAFRVVQTANRLYAVGRIDSTADVEDFVEAIFDGQAPDAVATTTSYGSNALVGTELSYPLNEVVLFSRSLPDTMRITVQSAHYVEWPS